MCIMNFFAFVPFLREISLTTGLCNRALYSVDVFDFASYARKRIQPLFATAILIGDGILPKRFSCVNLSSSDIIVWQTYPVWLSSSVMLCLVSSRMVEGSCRPLFLTWSFFGTNFRNFSLLALSDLFCKVLSWKRVHHSSPHFSHQFENDAFRLFPTWGQSGRIESSDRYGSISPFSILDLIISKAVLLNDSQSVDRTKTSMRLQMSPLSRQWSQRLKDGT